MATYAEVSEIINDGGLNNKVTSGIALKAHDILNEASPTAPRKQWAEEAIINPTSKVREMLWYMITDNISSTKAQILNASDQAIYDAVTEAVAKRIAAN